MRRILSRARIACLAILTALVVLIWTPVLSAPAGQVIVGWQGLLWVASDIGNSLRKFTSQISSLTLGLVSRIMYNANQVSGAIKTAVSQEAATAQLIADTRRSSASQLAASIDASFVKEQVTKSYLNYDVRFGQGYDACGTNAKNRTMDIAFDEVPRRARERVAATDVAPGAMVASRVQAMQTRLKTHLDRFCSDAEAQAGLCQTSELPGGDTNAGLLFDAADEDSLEVEARQAYIQHVLGGPDERLAREAGATPAGESFFVSKNRKDSLMSIPAYSLSMIDAANTRSQEFDGRSANEVLKERVNQYFGGPEAEQWSGSMARQTMRGLLVEANRMAGLEAWILYKQYEQNQRLEANLSALSIASSEKAAREMDGYQQKVASDRRNAEIQ